MSESPNPHAGGFFAGKTFRVLLVLLVLLLVGLGAFKWIKDNTTLTFGFMLDGRPLPIGAKPTVLVDGQPFASGCSILPGNHTLTAESKIADPISQKVWITCGNKNLGLLPLVSSKGSLLLTANPSPAGIVVRRGTETVATGDSPLTVEKLPFGNYDVEFKRGEYTESHIVKIAGRERTEAKIDLNLGGARLSSDPPDADFQLVGNGRQWEGKLPSSISDVPAGSYLFTATRSGWEVTTPFSVTAGVILPNQLVFPYGAVEVNSDPPGMRVTTNGMAVGKTPVMLNEVRPGDYTVVASDGFNELSSNIQVGEGKTVGHNFVFRYGKVEIDSNPTGATVTKNNKDLGKTPYVIPKLATGKTQLGLRLAGYVTTNYLIAAKEGTTASFVLKLTSVEFLAARQLAQSALDARQLADCRKYITRALEIEASDATALLLRDQLAQAELKAEAERKEAERRAEAERKEAEHREMVDIIENAITAREEGKL